MIVLFSTFSLGWLYLLRFDTESNNHYIDARIKIDQKKYIQDSFNQKKKLHDDSLVRNNNPGKGILSKSLPSYQKNKVHFSDSVDEKDDIYDQFI